MTRWVSFGVCGLVLAGSVYAVAQHQSTFERITVTNTAVGVATATTNPTGRQQMNTCYARLESGGVYFRDDGTDPTATVGAPLDVGDTVTISGNSIARSIRFIRSASTNGILSVRCYP